MDRAGPAQRGLASHVGSGQSHDIAQVMDEQGAGIDIVLAPLSVDRQGQSHSRCSPWKSHRPFSRREMERLTSPRQSTRPGRAASGLPSAPACLQRTKNLISFVTSLFDDGGDGAETPRQARHSKHPAYGRVIGVSSGLIVTQESKVYPTIDDAVRAARSAAVNRARATGREAYGFIYTSNGGFTYSGPFDTERESGGRIPVELDSAAMYHTHRWSALLSSDDIDYMNVRSRKPIYVLTVPPLGEPPESGGIIKFMPGHEGEPFMLP